ncbi:hypothetical protein [Modestobacter lapidis]
MAALGRAAAATGVLCIAAHVATAAAGGGHGGPVGTALFLAMAVACLPCVRALWRHPTAGVWRFTGLMYGGMLLVHLLLITAAQGSAHAGHLAGGPTWTELGVWGGLLLAGVEVVLAGTVLASGRVREQQLVGLGAGSG